VDILFKTQQLMKLCNDTKKAAKEWGAACATKLRRRLDEIDSAENLAVLSSTPGHCHELKGDRAGCIAIRLQGGRRLIFEPAETPPPRKEDGGLDRQQVTAIVIVAVEDYHD